MLQEEFCGHFTALYVYVCMYTYICVCVCMYVCVCMFLRAESWHREEIEENCERKKLDFQSRFKTSLVLRALSREFACMT